MIITISGQAGSGKSTVAKLLAKKLRYRHYSAGDMRRKLATERGMSLREFNALGETDQSTDQEPDEYQRKLGKTEDNLVIDGRMSFHFIPHSRKIFLTALRDVRARRVFHDAREGERFRSVEETARALDEREQSDRRRYKTYYGVDAFEPDQYDLVIDTSAIRPDAVVKKILAFLKTGKRN